MKAKILTIFYILATLAVIVYIWAFTQDQYESKAQFAITQEDASQEMASGLMGLISSGTTSNSDTQLLIGYINSADLLIELEKHFKLESHYTSPQQDIYFRLSADAQLEERLEYYRKHIFADFNQTTGLTEISATTFEPTLSQEILDYILAKSKVFINKMNTTIASEKLEFVEQELAASKSKVEDIKEQITKFQNEHNIISPTPVIQAQLENINGLTQTKITLEIKIESIAAANPESPLLPQLRQELKSLEAQIEQMRTTITGEEGQKLNDILRQYSDLTKKLEFAMGLQQATEVLMEQTRVETISNTRFFTTIQAPFYPEEAIHPKKEKLTITIVICSLLIFSIISALTRSMFDRM